MAHATHLVDILIPTYNYGRFIGECLASVAAQTFKSFKVYVQDNASTDDTESIVRAWMDKIPIEYERNQSNFGVSANHNLLSQKATAKYHVYFYADDLWEPEFLEKTISALEDNLQCLLAYTDWEMFMDDTGDIIPMSVPFRGAGSGIHRDDVALLWNNYITPSFTVRRASLHQHIHLPCNGLEMLCDHLFAFHVAAGYAVYFVDKNLGRYRKHGKSDTDRLFASGKAMDELCVFYSRIYADFDYGVPLRLLAKLCEVAKLNGRGPCWAYKNLSAPDSRLAKWITQQQEKVIPLIAQLVFAWPTLAHERREAYALLLETGWEHPGIVPKDLMLLIERAPEISGFQMPSKIRLRAIDGEHFARRMHHQWRIHPRFTVLLDAPEKALSDQIYDGWQLLTPPSSETPLAEILQDCTGCDDWVLLVPPGTCLAPTALFALADAINRNPSWQAIYADDTIHAGCSPRFKPDFDAPLLAEVDYLGVMAIAAPAFHALAAGAPFVPGLAYVLAWQIANTLGETAIGHVQEALFSLPSSFLGASPELRQACTASRRHVVPHPLPDPPLEGEGVEFPVVLPIPATPHELALAIASTSSALICLITPGLDPIDSSWVTTQVGVNLPPLQGEGWGGDGVLRGILPPIPLPASPLKGEESCVPTGPEWLPSWLQTLTDTLSTWKAAAVGPAILDEQDLLTDAGFALGIGGSVGPLFPGTPVDQPGDLIGRATLPHRVAALSGQCLLISRERLQEIGGIDTRYHSVTGCLVDACVRLHRAGHTLIWTPAARLRKTADLPVGATEPVESLERFLGNHLPALANDPFWNRNLSLQTGRYTVETDLVPRWETARRDVLRILALPMLPSGQAEYRVTAPMRMLDEAGLAQVTLACEPHVGRERAPTPVELARMAPDTLYFQAAVDDVRLQGLLTAARINPTIFRVFSLDDRISDIPTYNDAHAKLPKGKVVERMKLALANCQRLIVSTAPLAELYREAIDDIHIVPNRLERALWETAPQPRRRTGKKPRVGWAGALQHEDDLAIIAPVIEALADEVDWVFFGMMPKGCESFVTEFHLPVQPYAAYPAKLASLNLDLALAPLEINLFNEAKSNLRLIEYGFFGWPVIATDIIPYREAPVTRVTNTTEAWITAIREHLHDQDELTRRGQVLSEWVQTHYMLEDHPNDWLRALTP
ncbi:MAG: glycosyltransferase [Rhodocyclaceae bacterium]|nr:glycosyltransferase [Rhodocyclaceae bacterium]